MAVERPLLKAALCGVVGLAVVLPAAEASAQRRNERNNNNAAATAYRDVGSPGSVGGVGTESQDIVGMSEEMMRDLLTVPLLMNRNPAPRIIVDAKYFTNESSEIIDKSLITDRLRVMLNRNASGRLQFVGRQYAAAVEEERELKREGVTDSGTTGLARAQLGADYRLVGRIGTRDAVDPRTGVRSRYSMYTFEILDMESGELVWSNLYEFKKENRENVVYR